MPSIKPTPQQIRYLQYFAQREDEHQTTWTQSPLAVWHALHPEGTEMTQAQLVWRVRKAFTAMKSQGWITEDHVTHRLADDEVNVRTVEEAVYRITDRGRRALVEAGASPVITRRVVQREAPSSSGGAETIVLVGGPADGRVVTLPVGQHDRVLFAHRGQDVPYRRSKRPAVDGHPVFVPAATVDA